MKKSFKSGLMCVALSLSFAIPSYAASPNEAVGKINYNELKEANQAYFEYVKSGDKGEFADKKAIKIKEKYEKLFRDNPSLEKEYAKTIDVYSEEAINKDINKTIREISTATQTEDEEIKYVQLEDGSFYSVEHTLTKLPDQFNGVQALSDTQWSSPYGSYQDQYVVVTYHFMYPDTKLGLTSFLNFTSTELTVYDTTDAGTWSQLPLVVVNASTAITDSSSKNSSDYARTRGSYIVNILGTNGVALLSFRAYLNSDYTLVEPLMYGVKWTYSHSWSGIQ